MAETTCRDCGTATGKPLARYCDACRWKHRGKPERYPFTPERQAYIREHYQPSPHRGRCGMSVLVPNGSAEARRIKWRDKMRAAGRCLICGGEKPNPETACRSCLDRREAKRKARVRAVIEARLAAGGKAHGNRGCGGFGAHPEHIHRAPAADLRAAGRKGGLASAKNRAAAAVAEGLVHFRRALFAVRSDFTPEQIRDMERVFVLVFRHGDERGYSRGFQAGERSGRRRQQAGEPAA